MSTGEILGGAWEITWRHRFLWIFGFFAGLSLPGSDRRQVLFGGAWIFPLIGDWIQRFTPSLAFGIGLALVFWLLGLAARVSLVQSVAELRQSSGRGRRRRKKRRTQQEKISSGSLGTRFRRGFVLLPKIVGMQILVWLPVFILNVVAGLQFQSVFQVSRTGIQPVSECTFVLLSCGIGLLSLGSTLTEVFAFRAVAIDGVSLGKSIWFAIKTVIDNLVKILAVSVILVVILLVIGFLVLILLAPVLQALMAPQMAAMQECMAIHKQNVEALRDCITQYRASRGMAADLMLYGLGILAAVPMSVVTTYVSAVGTLLYEATADKSALKMDA